ncbi:peptidoglycan endopeptidase [Erwinia endophytica]|uniref:C40 family peptidase n=1 Tax=Erwinia endophytica TaxID=1563158 RepID=UPI001265DBE8|nr:C40 family peptidase [Erwinia endophytica]KAB8307588.1 peptidoglycan endopeptidase [Erwinia endophytica]
MRLLITLFMLAMAQLFLNMAHASPRSPVNANHHKVDSNTAARDDQRRKRRPVKTIFTRKVKESSVKKPLLSSVHKFKFKKKSSLETAAIKHKSSITKKHYGRHRGNPVEETEELTAGADTPLRLSKAHRARYQKARETAMNKLMNQLGKPYQWGGTSPRTGFDCSGLVWYAYKDLVKFKIPRTANEMYHLRDAASVKRDELEKGDLVFFRIHSRSAADHVGVYLGNGKFIQSPRSGKDIQVSALSDDYWQRHYIGARRMVTPKTIR